MTDYDLPAYRCTECGEQPALIVDNTAGCGRPGLGCKCTQENGRPFVAVDASKSFGLMIPDRWVLQDE